MYVKSFFLLIFVCVCVCLPCAAIWPTCDVTVRTNFILPYTHFFLAPTSEYILLTCWCVGALLSLWLFHYSSYSATASWVNIPTVNNSEQRPRFLEPCALTIETTSWTVEGNDWEEVWTASIGNTIIDTKEAGYSWAVCPPSEEKSMRFAKGMCETVHAISLSFLLYSPYRDEGLYSVSF